MRVSPGTLPQTMANMLAVDTDECQVWPHSLDKDGYAGMVGRRKAHHVACEHRHGTRPQGYEAAHSCKTKACVNPRHLRWATRLENEQDKIAHGTVNRGERQGHSKLTADDVRQIRDAVERGEAKQDVAARFGVVPSNVTSIVQRKTWKHV